MSGTRMPSDAADKVMLRLPDGVRPRLLEIARANGRSMNAEIVARILASLGEAPDLGEASGSLAVPLAQPRRDVRDILEEQTDLLRRIAERLAPD